MIPPPNPTPARRAASALFWTPASLTPLAMRRLCTEALRPPRQAPLRHTGALTDFQKQFEETAFFFLLTNKEANRFFPCLALCVPGLTQMKKHKLARIPGMVNASPDSSSETKVLVALR